MGQAKRPEVTEKDVVGLKYFDKVTPLLAWLHDAGCVRDKAGNRTLHFDQYCSLVLLFLFNPIVRSLRAIQQASELKNVQKKLGCARASLGSLSESVHVFDPTLLEGIIAELGQQLRPLATDPKLKDLKQVVTLVDGLRADAQKEDIAKAPDGESDLFWFHDLFWNQAYGIEAPGFSIVSNSGPKD